MWPEPIPMKDKFHGNLEDLRTFREADRYLCLAYHEEDEV